MRRSKNDKTPAEGLHESDLTQELERLVNENNALLKVLKEITNKEKPTRAHVTKPDKKENDSKK